MGSSGRNTPIAATGLVALLIAAAAPAAAQDEPASSPDPQPETTPEPATEPPAEQPDAKKSWTDYVKPKADLRYRVELIDTDDADLRYRHRIRARAGLVGTISESFEAEIQVGTGEAGDPVSNNQTMTEAFSSKPLWLSLAYFHWHPTGWIDEVHLTGGKIKNPFVTVGESELLWDPDLHPEGMALNLAHDFGVVQPIATGGAFFVEERRQDDDAWLFGAQLSLRFHFVEDKLFFHLGGGYYNYTGIQGHEVLWDPTDSFGNSAHPSDPAVEDSPLIYEDDYDVFEGFAEIGGEIGPVPWAVFGSIAYNIALEDDNLGWLAGVLVGETKETLDLYARYIYRQVQSDYTFALFTDSDFKGGGTDGTGHEWNVGVVVYKPISLAVTYFYNKTPYEDGDAYHRAQFDLKMKF